MRPSKRPGSSGRAGHPTSHAGCRSTPSSRGSRRPRPAPPPASSRCAESSAALAMPTVPVEADANPARAARRPDKVNRLSSHEIRRADRQSAAHHYGPFQGSFGQTRAPRRCAMSSARPPVPTLGTGRRRQCVRRPHSLIRGFDARSDIFIDGVRDPSIGIRENFNVEQIEILKGPASSFAGRGTAGGALNLVTKKATDESFRRARRDARQCPHQARARSTSIR